MPVRGRARTLVAAAVLGLAVVSAVACNGGSSGNSTTTPGSVSGSTTPSGTSTPAGTPTPHPQPTIEGSNFTFPGRGYAATIPDGWHANPNSLLAGPQKVDTFFSNDTVAGVQSNISVTCEDNPSNVSAADFVNQRKTTLQSLGANDIQTLAPPTVSGVPTQEVTYTLTRNNVVIRKLDVMFVTPTCAWTLASASAPSVASQNADIFAQFLASFRLLGNATPTSGG